MTILNVLSLKAQNNNGQSILFLTTTTNHGINTEYVNINITGATEPKYNGVFKFYVISPTTLKFSQEIYTNQAIITPLVDVAGVIVADTVDNNTLAQTTINAKALLYTISALGNYQILVDETKVYRMHVNSAESLNCRIGLRLSDNDRILYQTRGQVPIGFGIGVKWLIIEVITFKTPIEIRLILSN